MNRSLKTCALWSAVPAMLLALAGHAQGQCTPKWVRLFPDTVPPVRYAAAFAFDRASGVAVMYGGNTTSGGRLGDTWTWDGINWTQRNAGRPAGLGVLSNAAAGYSSFYGKVVMHGGQTPTTTAAAAYAFDPAGQGTWIPLSSNVGLARYNHTITDIGPSMMISGGVISPCSNGSSGILLRTTDWFATTGITDQWATQTHGAFYRTVGDRLYMVGGSLIATNCATNTSNGTSDSAVFPNANTTNQTRTLQANPFSARNNLGLADNFESDQVVVFGGATINNFPSATGLLGDTWIRGSNGVWTQLAGDGPSSRRAYNAMVYDSVRDQVLLFGGHNGGPMNDTWVLTTKPAIAIQPADQVARVGSTAVLVAPADGPGVLSYQWRRNGVGLVNGVSGNGSAYVGANTMALGISGVTWDDDAQYDVLVVNACGSVTSRSVRLTVTGPICYANCDGSAAAPVLNALDFQCFLNRFRAAAAGTATAEAAQYANCDGSTAAPALNALDFGCFLNRYRQGCP